MSVSTPNRWVNELQAGSFAVGCRPGALKACGLRVVPATTEGGATVEGTVFLHSVPRALVRSAEWTARHDPAAAKALSAYQTCCDAAWDPARPGTIQLGYVRPCAESVAPVGREIAATGDCVSVAERATVTGPG